MTNKILDPIRLPLNAISLIEASAGTGKTYTMVSLYLRLLLQVGENHFPIPLTVENILVVTFTEAATEELKKKIRERITQVKQQLIAYQQQQDHHLIADDPLLSAIVAQYSELELAIQRLKLAEQNMDMAAIYTIHGFCRRILIQYAFNSGIHFDLELSSDESELQHQLANQYWRQYYYPLSLETSAFIQQNLNSPSYVIQQLKPYLSGEPLKLAINQPHLLQLSVEQFIADYLEPNLQLVLQLKQQWLQAQTEIEKLIFDELDKSYKKGEAKRLKRTNFKRNHVANWLKLIADWANSPDNNLPSQLGKYFSQTGLSQNYVEDGAEPIRHSVFEQVDQVLTAIELQPIYHKILLWHYLTWLRQHLLAYKLKHKQKNFDDLLSLLQQVLCGSTDNQLAQLIQQQYPFAMIDEFQDTDKVQYDIFSQIYMQSCAEYNGFIMIGDPKQAIYKFRGADIFTYFKAAQQAQQTFNLNKNWRSSKGVVATVNQFFSLDKPAFLYDNIAFSPVKAQQDLQFSLDEQSQPPLVCYLTEENNKADFARICASSIQRWLALSQQQRALLNGKPIQANNIAILVRNWREAELIKTALAELNLAAVYLSEDKNVFDSKEAQELALILQACLNPLNERYILNAISTALFALNSAEIQRVKQLEQQAQYWFERFIGYQRIWQYQGVLAMLHRLFLAEEIPQKLLTQTNGERRLTDLLHLAELLQQASVLHENNSALLRWFEGQIQGKDRQDEQQIRLESEQDLIKIVTFHKSKGLEYDLVWLPFLAEPMKLSAGAIQTYYDEANQQIYWDLEQQHQDKILKETMAEELRLLYVALTRAKYQIAISLPQQFAAKQGWNALLYLLTQGEIGTTKQLTQPIDTAQYLNRICGDNAILAASELVTNEWQANSQPIHLAIREFTGKIEKLWQVSSFTALNNQQQWLKQQKSAVQNEQSFFDEAKDHDLYPSENNELLNLTATSLIPAEKQQYPMGYSPFDFPQGMQVGVALHRYFELCHFGQEVEPELIEQLCQQLQLEPQWTSSVAQWLGAVLNTPLVAHNTLTLAQVNPQQTWREWQFYLKLTDEFNLAKFNQILAQYHYPRPDFQFEPLAGMVRGFVDLIFCHQQQYYIVDYKSNHLGYQPEDYAAEQLQQYMLEANYDLQYLLYVLALHRYLRQRDPNYRYEQHFGGVIYTFLRGMNGQNSAYGVYFDKPAVELITQLDQLF